MEMVEFKSKKIAIYSMLMEDEFESSKLGLKSIFPQLNQNRQMFLLLNGSERQDIADYFSQVAHVSIFTSPVNLGVAGGRNFLIKKAQDKFNPDAYISFDNDLIAPTDYLDLLSSALFTTDIKKLGVIAPVVLKVDKLLVLEILNYNDLANNKRNSKETKSLVTNTRDKDIFYHLGVRFWKKHYLCTSFFNKIFPGKTTFLATDDLTRKKVLSEDNKWIAVDSLPGGVQCFKKELLDTIGVFDDKNFSPFGYEDADFCIRALKKGFKNFLIPEVFTIHDIDQRNSNRNLAYNMFLRGKAKRALIRKHIQNPLLKMLYTMDALVIHMPIELGTRLLQRPRRLGYRLSLRCFRKYWRGFWGYKYV